jgi:DNA-binding ferritin-like protein
MVDIEFGQPDECNGVDEMLNCLFDMNKALIDQYKNTIDCADKYREQGILNFLADRLDKHQMFQWQLTSFKA